MLEIIDMPEDGEFIAVNEEKVPVGEVMYLRRRDYLDVYHTGIREDFEGLGVASKMTKAVLELIRERGEKVYPRCPYMMNYISKHPEFEDVLYD